MHWHLLSRVNREPLSLLISSHSFHLFVLFPPLFVFHLVGHCEVLRSSNKCRSFHWSLFVFFFLFFVGFFYSLCVTKVSSSPSSCLVLQSFFEVSVVSFFVWERDLVWPLGRLEFLLGVELAVSIWEWWWIRENGGARSGRNWKLDVLGVTLWYLL